nr:hypothetical protein B11C_190036 [Bartonella sp. 1-1C]
MDNLAVWEGAMGEFMGEEYGGILREVVEEGLWRGKVSPF